MSSPSLIIGYGATQGDTLQEALLHAEDMLEEAILGMIAHNEEVPLPSPAKGRPVARLPALTAAKLEVYRAMRQAGLDAAQLAQQLGWPRRRSLISSTATTPSASNSSKPHSRCSAAASLWARNPDNRRPPMRKGQQRQAFSLSARLSRGRGTTRHSRRRSVSSGGIACRCPRSVIGASSQRRNVSGR